MLQNMETEAERATKKKLKKAAMQVIRWWCVFYSSMLKVELKPSSITWACIGDVMGLEIKNFSGGFIFSYFFRRERDYCPYRCASVLSEQEGTTDS